MHSEREVAKIIVFDIGGTWFRWGLYDPLRGLIGSQRAPAINYLSHSALSSADLQLALVELIARRVRELRDCVDDELHTASVSVGAPVNAHDMTILGSGPLWGPTAKPFDLVTHLRKSMPDVEWHIVNDVTALLAPHMSGNTSYRKTMLVTVSSGIGSRLYDHQARRIPVDAKYGIQGEIGHLVFPFELDGKLINRCCECGGWNHMNAFSSGRGIAQSLRCLPSLVSNYGAVVADTPDSWQQAGDEYRLSVFQAAIERGNDAATNLLDAFVTPLSRALAAAVSLDPDIDRIVITGGVAHGLGGHYRQALQRTFLRDGLYQITPHDPDYLARRLHWADPDDFAGLRGAGIYAERIAELRTHPQSGANEFEVFSISDLAHARN